MAKFTVRITGTAPVWADVEVEADSAAEAHRKVSDGDVPNLEELSSDAHKWEFCEMGNGIDDWSTTGEVYDSEGEECSDVEGDPGGKYECQNCDLPWNEDSLNPVEDLTMRVAPGELMPAGECPACGAVCHEKETGDERTR
jgi:hypothetical protein